MPQFKKILLLVLMGSALTACQQTVNEAVVVEYPSGVTQISSDFRSLQGIRGGIRRGGRHQGIDIEGPVGALVIAAADGVVLEVVTERCWGPTVVVDHGNDLSQKPLIGVYGHVGDVLVSEGDSVDRGQSIARLGDNADKYDCISGVRHLHFQLGRQYRNKAEKADYWGYSYFLRDGDRGVNPHLLWSDGPYRVTCYVEGSEYPEGSLTYPVSCE